MKQFKIISVADTGSREYIFATDGFYERVPPICNNLSALNESIKIDYERVWHTKAAYPALKIVKVDEVSVLGKGLIFKDDLLLYESVLHLNDKRILKLLNEWQAIKSSKTEALEGNSLVMNRVSSTNYGHWLIEFMPFAYLADAHKLSYERIILTYAQGSIARIQEECLAAINPDLPSKVFRAKRNIKYLADSACLPMQSCIHSHTKHPSLISAARDVGLSIIKGKSLDKYYDRIFINRPVGSSRSLLNSSEVFTILSSLGFQEIQPQNYSFEEQICLFNRANFVIGVSGAAMTNILFCNKNAKVICLTPDTHAIHFFWYLSNHLGFDFVFLFGTTFGKMHRDPFSIDIRALSESLERLEGS